MSFDSARQVEALNQNLAELSGDGRERAFVVASAAGYYGADRGDEVLAEASAPGDGPPQHDTRR